METIDEYKEGSQYENFINLAHNYRNSDTNGANAHLMQYLILAEKNRNEKNLSDIYGSPERRLANVKKYMLKAFDATLKRKWSEENRQKLEELRTFTEGSTHSAQLIDIIEMGLEILQGEKNK